MKIAYLTNQYPYVRHTFIRREILALEALGVEVARYSVRDSGGESVDPGDIAEKPRTTSLLAFGLPRLLLALLLTFLTRPLRTLRAAAQAVRLGRPAGAVLKHVVYLAEAALLRKLLRQQGATHLHVHFATNPAAVAMLCQTLGGPRYSITIHGPEEWDRPEALSLRAKYEGAAFVVAVSDFGRCQVYRWSGLEHWGKVHVVRCGIDAGFLGVTPTPVPDTPQLVLVAGFTEQKGHLLLLRSLQIVRARGRAFRMVFVGDGPLRGRIEAEIQARNLRECVQLVGWKSNAEVRQYLEASRALVMPSLAENLPVAMMEALALGRPVLGTYIAGVPELIESGQTGWMVPAGNAEAAADAIEAILASSPQELTRLGQNGVVKVRRLHDAMTEAAKLRQLFADAGRADPPAAR